MSTAANIGEQRKVRGNIFIVRLGIKCLVNVIRIKMLTNNFCRRSGQRFVFEFRRHGHERHENATEISRTPRRRVHVVRQPKFEFSQRREWPVVERQRTEIEIGSV